ncbi:hypothetical protein V1512DRAFT_265305 [Lipomyces arxii]|uniref:uncharacterized protein n=1 Tax=Lipomyces arxii TaxID=56418 RepID=UPI0034CECCE0
MSIFLESVDALCYFVGPFFPQILQPNRNGRDGTVYNILHHVLATVLCLLACCILFDGGAQLICFRVKSSLEILDYLKSALCVGYSLLLSIKLLFSVGRLYVLGFEVFRQLIVRASTQLVLAW